MPTVCAALTPERYQNSYHAHDGPASRRRDPEGDRFMLKSPPGAPKHSKSLRNTAVAVGNSRARETACLEIETVERDIPMSIEQLEPPTLFSLECRVIGEQPPGELVVARGTRSCGCAECQRHRESPVCPAVAVECGHIGLDVEQSTAFPLGLENRVVVPLKEIEELFLMSPPDAIEVPDRLSG
jgi:hypothetical protein